MAENIAWSFKLQFSNENLGFTTQKVYFTLKKYAF
jgi:hypothetical protein